MKVSVLITVKNMKKTIRKCLDSLLDQNFDKKYEIIIIDSLSTDGTQKILKKYSKENSKIKVVEHKCLQPEAYNYAIENNLLSGEIVALIDGDCVAEENWLSKIVEDLESGKDVVGGVGVTPPNAGFLQRLIGYDLDYRFLSTKEGYVKRHPNMNLAMKKEILEKTKFDENLPIAYDTEFGYRLRKIKKKIWFDPDIKVYHYHRTSFKAYTKQQVNSGKYALLVYQKMGSINTDNINPWWMICQPFFFTPTVLFLIFSLFFNKLFLLFLTFFIILNIIILYPVLKEISFFKEVEVILVYFLYWYRLLLWHVGAFFGLIYFIEKT